MQAVPDPTALADPAGQADLGGSALWEPWAYWRTVTLLMAGLWTLSGLARLLWFHHRWERRLEEVGASRRWLRRQLLQVVLRVTVLDPWNLGLLLLLAALWSSPWLWG